MVYVVKRPTAEDLALFAAKDRTTKTYAARIRGELQRAVEFKVYSDQLARQEWTRVAKRAERRYANQAGWPYSEPLLDPAELTRAATIIGATYA
jgi:hypothetical protein